MGFVEKKNRMKELMRWVGRWRWEKGWKDGWIGSHASHMVLYSPFSFLFGLFGWI